MADAPEITLPRLDPAALEEADRAYDDMAESLEVNACSTEALAWAIRNYLAHRSRQQEGA